MKKTGKKKTAKAKKTNVLIVGAGKGGSLLIELFHKSKTVKIAGIVDKNPRAPGMKLAKQFGLPHATHYKEFLRKKTIVEIINATGSTEVQDELLKLKPPRSEVIGGLSAKLIWDLIEERKQIEESLQKNEEKFRLAFENANDAIFLADTKTGIIINCNKAAETLLEKKRNKIIGHHQSELHPPQLNKKHLNVFKKHISAQTLYDDESEVITKSGKIIPVIITPSITLLDNKTRVKSQFSH